MVFSIVHLLLLVTAGTLRGTLVGANKCQATAPDSLGPFFLPNQPVSDKICQGDSEFINQKKLYIRGRVLDEDCMSPLPNYKVEIWQADSEAKYHHEGRGCASTLYTGKQGEFQFITVPPGHYRISGSLFRPRHIHLMVTDGNGSCHETLVTQVYFKRNDILGRESCEMDCPFVDDTNIMFNLDVFDKSLPRSLRKCAGVIYGEFNLVLRRKQSAHCMFPQPEMITWKGFKCPSLNCPSKRQCNNKANTSISSAVNFDFTVKIKVQKKSEKCSFVGKIIEVNKGQVTLSQLQFKKNVKVKIYLNRKDLCLYKGNSYSISGLFADLAHKDITVSEMSSVNFL